MNVPPFLRRMAPAPSTWFRGFRTDVEPDDDDDGLTEQRLEQWRPFSQNPFSHPDHGLTPVPDRPQTLVVEVTDDEKAKVLDKPDISRANSGLSQQNFTSNSVTVVHAGPAWTHLFYDLAWAATFSTLTQNGSFDGPWDNLSYFTFFLLMWWLWASQTLYTIHFYTNDWVHLISIFVQLVIFGLLAATTHDYNVSSYILKLKGADKETIDDIFDPGKYLEDRVTSYSLYVIAFSIAASRTVHWFQHLNVGIHAYRTAARLKLRIPLKSLVLPIGLIAPVGLYWATAALTYLRGKTVRWAKLKFALWGVALLLEFALHGYMEYRDWEKSSSRNPKESDISHNVPPQPELLEVPAGSPTSSIEPNQGWPEPRSDVNLRERLEGITTVILGEGLNGIAGTFYAVISAPGLGGPVAVNVACAAIIIYLLAYFYFEGPTGHRDLKGKKLRQAVWLVLHFPLMICVILLLLGVKNQFLLTSYLSTGGRTFARLDDVMAAQNIILDDPASINNMPLKNFLLKRGLVWREEFHALNDTVTRNGSIPLNEVDDERLIEGANVWANQVSLKIMVNLYKTFMGENEEIADDIQKQIQEYYTNNTLALEDYKEMHKESSSYHYIQILSKLLDGHLLGARYISGLAGIILISLGLMNRVHSKARDRFQWGIILSRIIMGCALLLLEILNVGHYQTLWIIEGQENGLAGVVRWIWAWWVLPTLAIAFAVEFFIELALLRSAGLAIARKRGHASGPLRHMYFRRRYGWSSQAK